MISAGFNFNNSTDANKLAKSLASVQLWNSSDVDGSPGLNKEFNNLSLFNAIPVGKGREVLLIILFKGNTNVFLVKK